MRSLPRAPRTRGDQAANVMVDDACVCKVSDFGLSKTIGVDAGGAVVDAGGGCDTSGGDSSTNGAAGVLRLTAETGTYRWMAPEVLSHMPYSFPCDVFSFAILMFEVMVGKPYSDLTPVQARLTAATSPASETLSNCLARAAPAALRVRLYRHRPSHSSPPRPPSSGAGRAGGVPQRPSARFPAELAPRPELSAPPRGALLGRRRRRSAQLHSRRGGAAGAAASRYRDSMGRFAPLLLLCSSLTARVRPPATSAEANGPRPCSGVGEPLGRGDSGSGGRTAAGQGALAAAGAAEWRPAHCALCHAALRSARGIRSLALIMSCDNNERGERSQSGHSRQPFETAARRPPQSRTIGSFTDVSPKWTISPSAATDRGGAARKGRVRSKTDDRGEPSSGDAGEREKSSWWSPRGLFSRGGFRFT